MGQNKIIQGYALTPPSHCSSWATFAPGTASCPPALGAASTALHTGPDLRERSTEDVVFKWSQISEARCTCGTQRMSFRDESTTGVHYKLASVGVVPSVNELPSFTWRERCQTSVVLLVLQPSIAVDHNLHVLVMGL
ncbi:hypothetical protein INR49_017415, partial [Caranx melampygus]